MEEYLGQIQAFAFNYAPRGWAFCNGQLLPISQNQALFALLGTTYGGDGINTFALPDLRGRSIVHPGQGPGLSNIVLGQKGGTENVTLVSSNMPAHTHDLSRMTVSTTVMVNNGSAINETDNGNNTFGYGGSYPAIYSEPPIANKQYVGGVQTTISGTTGVQGGSQPFSNRSPFLGVYMSIALQGIFPPRD